jgi:hypothetical protein
MKENEQNEKKKKRKSTKATLVCVEVCTEEAECAVVELEAHANAALVSLHVRLRDTGTELEEE